MNRWRTGLIVLLCLCLLTGCGIQYPLTEEDGSVVLSPQLRISQPNYPVSLGEYQDTLADMGIYYATWTMGEGETITDEEGKESTRHPVQIYVLIQQCETEQEAAQQPEQWQMLLGERQEISHTDLQTVEEQTYLLASYAFAEAETFACGISAYTSVGTYAVAVEAVCLEDDSGELLDILTDFLACMHYTI